MFGIFVQSRSLPSMRRALGRVLPIREIRDPQNFRIRCQPSKLLSATSTIDSFPRAAENTKPYRPPPPEVLRKECLLSRVS